MLYERLYQQSTHMSIAEFLSISQRDWTVSVIFTVTLLEVDPIFDFFFLYSVFAGPKNG